MESGSRETPWGIWLCSRHAIYKQAWILVSGGSHNLRASADCPWYSGKSLEKLAAHLGVLTYLRDNFLMAAAICYMEKKCKRWPWKDQCGEYILQTPIPFGVLTHEAQRMRHHYCGASQPTGCFFLVIWSCIFHFPNNEKVKSYTVIKVDLSS